jgi:hypothetical protein
MRTHVIASLVASLAFTAGAFAATAPPLDSSRLSSRYSDWAGGKANADALVAGLTHGTSIALVTRGPNRTVSLAGFTVAGPMSYSEAESALAGARRRLDGLGIGRPSAEQIQAALIGGDITTPAGATVMIEGRVAASGAGPG